MSLPVGLGADSGLPVGLQLMGPAFSEETMLGAAHCLEQTLPSLPTPAC
jgi:aspartyl-tRNA(Asn)/glutamyl-tRNA(Gln) amidotransferase subunit A